MKNVTPKKKVKKPASKSQKQLSKLQREEQVQQDLSALSKAYKAARIKQGYTQAQVAKKAKVPIKLVQTMETDCGDLDILDAKRVAKVLNLHLRLVDRRTNKVTAELF